MNILMGIFTAISFAFFIAGMFFARKSHDYEKAYWANFIALLIVMYANLFEPCVS